jgi:3-hydroxyisobutyrate dehydrogenase-like beta-hydroxyacid dehydrogenase
MERSVALIGMGLMGAALAERLLAGGWTVRGFDIDPARMDALAALGGTPASSAAEAAAGSAFVLTCLMTADITRDAVLGEQGAAAGMRARAVLVDAGTCAPSDSRRLSEELAARGVPMLDAPVSGGSASARAGEAVIMAGGPAEAFERGRPLFAAFARRAIHAGPSGAGSTAKLVTNLVLGLNRLALAEGLALGLRAGLEPQPLLELLRESAAYSRALDTKGERMVAGRFEPEARLSQHLKDVRLILDLARELDLALPASALHERLLEEAVAHGLGELDNSAIIALLRPLDEPAPEPP